MNKYKKTVSDYAETDLKEIFIDETGEFDDFLYEETLKSLVNQKYSSFLIMLKNSTWNKRSGYKIVNNINEVLDRGYNCSINPLNSYKNGKVLELVETSHDAPTGYVSYIVGLSQKELAKIENTMEFDEIEEFIDELVVAA